MSRIRGVFPLLLATGVGVSSGIYIFGPLLKEEKDNRKDKERQELKTLHPLENAASETLRNTDPVAFPAEPDNTTVEPVDSSSSWWSKMIWDRSGKNESTLKSKEGPPRMTGPNSAKPS